MPTSQGLTKEFVSGLTTGNISTPRNWSIYEWKICNLLDKYSLKNEEKPAFRFVYFIIDVSLFRLNLKYLFG